MPSNKPKLLDIDEDEWAQALAREPIIRELASLERIPLRMRKDAQDALGLNRTWILELVARYRENPVTSSSSCIWNSADSNLGDGSTPSDRDASWQKGC